MPKRYTNNSILVYGDIHAPYHHPDTLDFLRDTARTYSPDRIIDLGDDLDMYTVSDYPKDIEHEDNWNAEFKKGRKFIQQLGTLFPDQEVLSSNHCDRAYKKSRVAGVPREFLIPFLKVIDAPVGWRLKDYIRLTVDSTRQHWLFQHTMISGSLEAAKNLGVSVCLGHSHTKFGIQSFHNGFNHLYGVDAGCLISDKGSPFAYNKNQIGRPIRGCVVILEGIPQLVPMKS